MPNPLSRVRPNAAFNLGNNIDNPSDHRPELALLAMKVIAEWSLLESFMTGVFVHMLGSNPTPALAIYTALSGSVSRGAAFKAVAKEAHLSTEEDEILDAILSLYKTAGRERNRIAHWVWGHSPEIPDGVLLCDQQVMARTWIATSPQLVGDTADEITATIAETRSVLGDATFVYKANDFESLSRDTQRLINLVTQFRFVLMRDHPSNRGGALLQTLSLEPEIHTWRNRQRLGPKTDDTTPLPAVT